jgi:hypothetical protein
MSDTGFDAKAALKLGEKKLAPKLGDYTLAELRQLEAAERGEGGSARSGVLRLLQAEIGARAGAAAAQLSPASIEQIAKACHDFNAAFCRSLGDGSQLEWDEAPDWQRESAVKGVEFCVSNPDAPPSANHESWSAQKLADGWTYGEVKDPKKKTHPCLVPFDELPADQQFKDVLFKHTVATLAPIYNRVEALSAELDALNAPRATTEVPAGSVAEVKAGSVKASTLLKDVAALAVCPAGDEDGPVNAYFTVPVSAEDFEISETFRKAKYLHAIKLTHDMEPMAAAQVVALDSAGRPLARVAWGVPLYAGGGRNGEFSAGYIAFDV